MRHAKVNRSAQRVKPRAPRAALSWWRVLAPLAVAALLTLADDASAALVYGQRDGLANLSVQSAALDDEGYVWAGTEDGAMRFDGHRFLRIDLAVPGAVPDNHAFRLLALPGALYIATPSRALRYDLHSHALSVLRDAGAELTQVSALASGADGWVYATSEAGRLWRWHDSAGQTPRVEAIALHPDQPIGDVYGAHFGSGALLLATEHGAFRVDPATGAATALRFAEPELHDGDARAQSVYEFPAGVLWIGYYNDALLRLDTGTGVHRWFHPARPGAGALRSTSIYAMASRPDRLYIGTNRGIVVFHPDCDCLHGLNLPSWDQSLGMSVDAVVPEHDGLWAGVWGGGLVRFSATDEVFERQVKPDNGAGGLAHTMVYSLHVDAERRLWIGTYGGGVQYAPIDSLREGEPWKLERLPMAGLRVESNMIWSLDSTAGGLTIGTGRSLFRWDGAALRELPGAHDIESVRYTLQRADGRRYIATYGSGLFREGDGVIVPVAGDATAPMQLPRAIWSLAEDQGELWLGTTQGVVRLDDNERVVAAHGPGTGQDQLPGGVVWVQKHDARGRLWLGTSGGLVRVERADSALRFERQAPLVATGVKAVSSIEFDRSGQLWLGTPNGLVRYRPDDGGVDRYNVDDGLISTQINIHASTNDGRRLYFGGMGGLVAFDPAAMPERQIALTPRVARLRLGQQPWQLDARSLSLEHQHEPIQVEFTALAYADAARVRYAYRWQGLDADFVELGDAQSTVLSRLPTGEHTLELRASTPAPNARETVAQVLAVTIAPAWYETAWGRLLVLAAAFGSVYGWLQWRLRRARAHARELEGKVEQRTRQLDRTAHDLAAANARLKVQATQDPLTGLANRHHLFELYAERQGAGAPPGLVICDLDHFKRVNDSYGHQIGDEVLKDFAGVLRSALGGDGLAARFGGEEFVVLLFDRAPGALEALAARIIEGARTRRVPRPGHADIGYSSSAGIARGLAGEALEEHVARADGALYAAKHAGRDRWCSVDTLADPAPAGEAA